MVRGIQGLSRETVRAQGWSGECRVHPGKPVLRVGPADLGFIQRSCAYAWSRGLRVYPGKLRLRLVQRTPAAWSLGQIIAYTTYCNFVIN